jgi:hypothetical protein
VLQVVDTVENESTQVTVAEAMRRNPGQGRRPIAESLPPSISVVAAQNAKQVIVQKVRGPSASASSASSRTAWARLPAELSSGWVRQRHCRS